MLPPFNYFLHYENIVYEHIQALQNLHNAQIFISSGRLAANACVNDGRIPIINNGRIPDVRRQNAVYLGKKWQGASSILIFSKLLDLTNTASQVGDKATYSFY